MTNNSHLPAGTAKGGQFAAQSRSDADFALQSGSVVISGTPLFVGWDTDIEAFHIEIGETVVEAPNPGDYYIAGSSTSPFARQASDGTITLAFVVEGEDGEPGNTGLQVAKLSADGTCLSTDYTGAIGYDAAEKQLEALRGDIEPPAHVNFYDL